MLSHHFRHQFIRITFVAVFALLLAFTTKVKAMEALTSQQEFVQCESVDGDVQFQILMEVRNKNESPQALGMTVTDLNVSADRSEIATFMYNDGVLNNTNGVVVGYVDLANPRTSRKGERIAGTRLGHLRSIMVDLDIDFTTRPTVGEKYSAQAVYLKKIGEELVQDLDCSRGK